MKHWMEWIGRIFGILIVIVLPLMVTVSGFIEIATRPESTEEVSCPPGFSCDFIFFYDEDRPLSQVTIKRLELIREFDNLGCGNEKPEGVVVDRSAIEAECLSIINALLFEKPTVHD